MHTFDSTIPFGRRSTPPRLRPHGRALLAAFGLLLAASVGCMPNPLPPPSAPPIERYVVGAPDVLKISILPEPEILRDVRVRPDGMISIDLVGDIQAAGRTPQQIAAAVQEKISRYKRDAAVNVTVIESPSQFVTVYGEVARPGIFALDAETRVSEAIGRVGGTKPFASLNSVRVIRTYGHETEVIEIKLADIQKGDLSSNIVVNEGDLIVVPPTVLARIGYVMQMLFFPFQPVVSTLSAVGTTAAGVNTIGNF